MNKEDFKEFSNEKPLEGRWLIVTNNINATNNRGEMSHLWLTNFVQKPSGENCGDFICFDDADRKICFLSHWKYA